MAPRTTADRLLSPDARALLRRAAWLSLAGAALWPVQALAVAVAISGWVTGAGLARGLTAAAVFAVVGMLRALAERRAARLAWTAADAAIHSHRRDLLDREALRPEGGPSSAALAALLTEKLAALAPWITRYHPAMLRTRWLPLLYLALIFPISWAAGLVLLVAGPLIPMFMALVGIAAKEASRRQMVEVGAMNTLLIDRIAALPDILLLNAAAASRRAFAVRAEALRTRTMAVLRVAFLSSTVLELFAALGVAMVALYVGLSLLGELTFGAWSTPLTLGEGIFLLLLAPDFFQPLRDLAAAWHDRAAAEAVADELDTLAAEAPLPVPGHGARVAPLPGPASVALEGVSVLRGVQRLVLPDLAVAAGEGVALCGPSGSGKTTALDLMAGLLRPDGGAVRVAGQALDPDTADAWRARIAFVPQHVHVPDVTLRAFLDPHGTGGISDALLARARADRIVAALPDGLDTRLGETGAGVSGGEARRLLLARALISGAGIVLADEPTADLDGSTAAAIIATLRELVAEGRTVIVASHDPALIAALDRTVPFGDGGAA